MVCAPRGSGPKAAAAPELPCRWAARSGARGVIAAVVLAVALPIMLVRDKRRGVARSDETAIGLLIESFDKVAARHDQVDLNRVVKVEQPPGCAVNKFNGNLFAATQRRAAMNRNR